MAGTMGGVKVLVFKNKKKRKQSDPDYMLCFDNAKPSEGEEPPPEE